MTVNDLIEKVMKRARQKFYHNRPAAEWHRDQNAIMKAIARYGYVCTERGWRFEANELCGRLFGVINDIERPEGQGWFPIYLETAVDRHVRERAEEIQAASLRAEGHIQKFMRNLPAVTEERQPVASEMVGAVYEEQRRRQKEKAASLRAAKEATNAQPDLFKGTS